MGKSSSRQIGRAPADGQIHPFDERRVQGRRVLGLGERLCEPPRRAHSGPSFDSNDAIVSSRFEYLTVESCWTKDATHDLLVELESVGDDQGKTLDIHAVRDVAQKRERVTVAASSGHRRRPEPRPHLDGDEHPRGPRLAADEGANFIGLELLDHESGNPSLVEATANVGGTLQPSSDGVPGNPLDPSNRGNADPLDPESNNRGIRLAGDGNRSKKLYLYNFRGYDITHAWPTSARDRRATNAPS